MFSLPFNDFSLLWNITLSKTSTGTHPSAYSLPKHDTLFCSCIFMKWFLLPTSCYRVLFDLLIHLFIQEWSILGLQIKWILFSTHIPLHWNAFLRVYSASYSPCLFYFSVWTLLFLSLFLTSLGRSLAFLSVYTFLSNIN